MSAQSESSYRSATQRMNAAAGLDATDSPSVTEPESKNVASDPFVTVSVRMRRSTRDRLAPLAERRGQSISWLVSDLAQRAADHLPAVKPPHPVATNARVRNLERKHSLHDDAATFITTTGKPRARRRSIDMEPATIAEWKRVHHHGGPDGGPATLAQLGAHFGLNAKQARHRLIAYGIRPHPQGRRRRA